MGQNSRLIWLVIYKDSIFQQSKKGMYVCVYVCMYVCMYVCIYIYISTYTVQEHQVQIWLWVTTLGTLTLVIKQQGFSQCSNIPDIPVWKEGIPPIMAI